MAKRKVTPAPQPQAPQAVPLKKFVGYINNGGDQPFGVQVLKNTINDLSYVPGLRAVYCETRSPVNNELVVTKFNLDNFLYYDLIPVEDTSDIPTPVVTGSGEVTGEGSTPEVSKDAG